MISGLWLAGQRPSLDSTMQNPRGSAQPPMNSRKCVNTLLYKHDIHNVY